MRGARGVRFSLLLFSGASCSSTVASEARSLHGNKWPWTELESDVSDMDVRSGSVSAAWRDQTRTPNHMEVNTTQNNRIQSFTPSKMR